MTKDRFKNALRFKLVQRSVRDQGYQGQPDANEDDGSCSATAVNGDKVRTFAPLNEASRERLVRPGRVVVFPYPQTFSWGRMKCWVYQMLNRDKQMLPPFRT